jgi:hypothetical protein
MYRGRKSGKNESLIARGQVRIMRNNTDETIFPRDGYYFPAR